MFRSSPLLVKHAQARLREAWCRLAHLQLREWTAPFAEFARACSPGAPKEHDSLSELLGSALPRAREILAHARAQQLRRLVNNRRLLLAAAVGPLMMLESSWAAGHTPALLPSAATVASITSAGSGWVLDCPRGSHVCQVSGEATWSRGTAVLSASVHTAKAPAKTAHTARTQPPSVAAAPPPPPPVYFPVTSQGVDISWPQCDGGNLPQKYGFSIVGVNDGRPFTINPCFVDEAGWSHGATSGGSPYLYVNMEIGFRQNGPRNCGPTDMTCQAYNYGAQSAQFAVNVARSVGVSSPVYWLDVEVGNNWSWNPDYNANVVSGAIDQLHTNGVIAGIYSTPIMWNLIAAGYKPGVPVWEAGAPDVGSALAYCQNAFAGGPVWLSQFGGGAVDWDMGCPH